ncbi:MAG: glutathione-disulfide reductase [Myxococcota bacterium]
MAGYDFDLVVIGAGSGGVRAARQSAGFGARVAIVEERFLGGTCVNVGCVPKKLFVYGAHFRDDFEDAAGYGWQVAPPRLDWSRLRANKDAEIRRLNGVYRRLLEQSGVELVEGRARLAGPHAVQVGERRLSAERILVATGSHPRRSDIPGHELARVSDDMFYLDTLPDRAVVAGGGYIAVEFASILHGLGVQVCLVHRRHLVLRGFDEDVRTVLTEEMSQRGIECRVAHTIEHIERSGGELAVTLDSGDVLRTDMVLSAIGRVPNTGDLGLEEMGVERGDSGEILVDDYFRSSVPSVYALGDVIDRVQLTPVAIHEAMALARSLFGDRRVTVDYDNIPTAVFSTPNVGTVGLTEAEARHQVPEVDVYRSIFTPLKHSMTGRAEKTLMKLVVDRRTERVLGIHMVGPDAGEIIQGFAVALRCGVTKPQLDATVGIHPTAAEELVTMRTKAPEPEGDEDPAEHG